MRAHNQMAGASVAPSSHTVYGFLGRFAAATIWLSALPAVAEIELKGDACSPAEAWAYGDLPADGVAAFEESRLMRSSKVRSFAEALAFRREAKSLNEKSFGEYWISRSLRTAKLPFAAAAGFTQTALREGAPRAVQQAAVDCLLEINAETPAVEISERVVDSLKDWPASRTKARAAAYEIRRRAGRGESVDKWSYLAKWTSGYPAYETFATLIVNVAKGDHENAVNFGEVYLNNKDRERDLARYDDSLRILVGRAHFSQRRFEPATRWLQSVQKSSNDLAHSLSDLSWAQLRAEQPAAAIGTAIGLQSGALRRTFAPEATMVMAMSFNELCHYPEALRAVSHFRGTYEHAYRWLEDWRNKGSSSKGLYTQAINFVKKTKGPGTAPDNVASEWIRTPHFIARQDAIRSWMNINEAARRFADEARALQVADARDLMETIRGVRLRYEKIRPAVEAGESDLTPALKKDIDILRRKVASYRKIKAASGPWSSTVKHLEARSSSERARLVADVENELGAVTGRMSLQLEEIAENLHFLEVEIYQGASQDLIWQNAHPDFKELVMTFKKENSRRDLASTWSWGSVQGAIEGAGEVWEDELGAFKADIVDNCESKDKYLTVKSQTTASRKE